MSKKMSCPECRAKIDGHIPNKVLDSYIEKFIENFVPKDFQDSRKILVEDRKRKMNERRAERAQPLHYGQDTQGSINCNFKLRAKKINICHVENY